MAHTKASGVTKGNRDSIAKRLGPKVFAGQNVLPGSIIVRQRGTRFLAGSGTKSGSDDTIYAVKEGKVLYKAYKGARMVVVS